MKLFAGLSRTDYEDIFRAVGALIDERGWSNVSLMEVEEGLIVQVMVKPTLRQTRPHLETYLLTEADLERVQRDAVRRRQKKEAPKSPPSEPAFARAKNAPGDPAPPPWCHRSAMARGDWSRIASPRSWRKGGAHRYRRSRPLLPRSRYLRCPRWKACRLSAG